MKRACNIARNLFAGFGLIVFLLVAAFAVATMWKAPIHQFNLWMLGKNFKMADLRHPEDSTYLLRVHDFGNLFRGASNGCDYLVGEMRVGRVPRGDILRRYEGVVIKSFDNTGPVPVEVRFFDKENWMDPYPWSDWSDRAKTYIDSDSTAPGGTLYMVFVRQSDFPPDGDIRCH